MRLLTWENSEMIAARLPSEAEITALLRKNSLFSELDDDILLHLVRERAEIARYLPLDTISDGAPALGVVLSGAVRILSHSAAVPLRLIEGGGVFGAASVFGAERYMTRICAELPSAVLLISPEVVADMIMTSPQFASAYVMFLSERVKYLNRKIEIFTAGTVEKKLAFYISEAAVSGVFTTSSGMSELAAALGVGRASLYRALDALSDAGCIEHRGKVIRILDREKLLSQI